MIMMADWHPDIIEFVISKMQNPDILRHIINTTKDDQIKQLAQEKLKFEPLSEVEKDVLSSSITYLGQVEDDLGRSLYEDENEPRVFAEKLLKDGGRYSVHNPDFLTGANIS